MTRTSTRPSWANASHTAGCTEAVSAPGPATTRDGSRTSSRARARAGARAPALALALLLVLLPSLVVAGPGALTASVQPAVWEALAQEGRVEVLVILREQADLSGAARLPGRATRGRYAYDSLQDVARRTQRSVRAFLQAEGCLLYTSDAADE